MKIKRDDILPYVSFCIDDACRYQSIDDIPANARLIGWQCGFEPMFVAVWSSVGNRLTDADAEDIAIAALLRRGWFAHEATPPDFCL